MRSLRSSVAVRTRRIAVTSIATRTRSGTDVGYAEMSVLAERSRARPLNAHVRSALVVAQPVQMGFARMFQILNEHPQVTVRIFEDEMAARVWIATGLPNDNEE